MSRYIQKVYKKYQLLKLIFKIEQYYSNYFQNLSKVLKFSVKLSNDLKNSGEELRFTNLRNSRVSPASTMVPVNFLDIVSVNNNFSS